VYINNTLYTSIYVSGNKKPIESLYLSYFAYTMIGKVTIKNFASNYNYLELILAKDKNITNDDGINGMAAVVGSNTFANIQKSFQARLLAPSDLTAGLNPREIAIFKKAFEIDELDIQYTDFLDPILRSTLIPKVIQDLADRKVCISYDNCLINDGFMAIINNTKKACVICGPNKTYNQVTNECECG